MNITVREFCLHHTQTGELIGICTPWLVHTVFIDCEDIFVIDNRYRNLKVKTDSWGTLTAVNQLGEKVKVPIHNLYVDLR